MFSSKKRDCYKCEIFVARAYGCLKAFGMDSLDDALMLRARPGVLCAGEMLDWEAPTGGYLLTACLATGRWAGRGAAAFLARSLCV